MKKDTLGSFRFLLQVIGLLVVFGAFSLPSYGQANNNDKLSGTLWTGSIRKDAYISLFISFDFGKGNTVRATIGDSKTKKVDEINGTYSRMKDAVTMKFPKITIEKAEVYQDCLDDECQPAEMIGLITLTPAEPKYHFTVTKQLR